MDIGKDLVAASSTPLILSILTAGESYGYAIVKQVGELSRGSLQWTEGMLYPLLHRLERQGYIDGCWGEAENGRKRKYYRITRSGRAHLTDQRRQWQAVDEALRNLWLGLSRTAGPGGAVQPAFEGG
jgi:DNA-binding PadR family transcriptional regulator